MLKIVTIVGTRPELIKMSRVIATFDKHTNHTLVHSGQNYDYELNQIFFDDLEIRKPDYFLEISRESPAKAIADVIEKSDSLFEELKPDAVLIYGDTNTCLAVISAKRRQIPIFHMEAGNRCFDQRVPEEINRKVVDHLSDINMVLTEHARRYLISEGIPQQTIIKTGSHMNEVLNYYGSKINDSTILQRTGLLPQRYFLVSAHREENVDAIQNLRGLIASLNALAESYQCPIYFSTHPRTRKNIERSSFNHLHPLIQFAKPLGFFDYNKLQTEALCILSDSGTITEEASLLNLPAVTMRAAHERPEGMDEGVLIMSSFREEKVLDAVGIIIEQNRDSQAKRQVVQDYTAENVSEKVLRIVSSYIEYVNRTVWYKS